MSTDLYDPLGPNAQMLNGGAMQQVKGSYSTAVAVQQPRVLADVQKRLIEEANLAGELFYYGWGAGKDQISGASVGLATAAARCWGNCAIELKPMQETAEAWLFTAAFVDLETGFTIERQFRQSKRSVVHGKHDNERKDDMRFQIGQSKAVRNVILNALPKWLTDKAQQAAEQGVRDHIEALVKQKGLPVAVDVAVKALKKEGVSAEAICAKFGVADVKALDVDHLVVLKGDLSALQNGQERAETLFALTAPQQAGGGAQPSGLNATLAHEDRMKEIKQQIAAATTRGALHELGTKYTGPETEIDNPEDLKQIAVWIGERLAELEAEKKK